MCENISQKFVSMKINARAAIDTMMLLYQISAICEDFKRPKTILKKIKHKTLYRKREKSYCTVSSYLIIQD